MKYQVGDRVLLLHSNEEGEVAEIINEKIILIDVDGVRFPVYMDQVDFPYFKRFSEKKIEFPKNIKRYVDNLKKDETPKEIKVSGGVWLSFLPIFNKDIFEDDVVEKLKMYLVNQSGDAYHFRYQINIKGLPYFELSNTALPFNEFYLHDIPFEEMNDSPKFEFEFSLLHSDKKKATNLEVFYKIKAKQLFQKIEEMKLKNEPAFSIILFENYPDKSEEIIPEYNSLPGQLYEVSRIKEKLEPPRSVVDLHIEKLTDNWKGMSNLEILSIQLNYFEKYYNLAVAHHQPNLIIIHGIGKGKLRGEIHEILKTKKEVRTFANQYHSNFGFGATEIFFQY